MDLLLPEEVQAHFKTESADVERIAPQLTTGLHRLSKKVMLHEMKVAELYWVFVSHQQTVLNECLVNVSSEYLKGRSQDLGR